MIAAPLHEARATAGPEQLTPERVFSAPGLGGPEIASGKFSPDGREVTFLKPREDAPDILDLWVVELDADATPRPLVTAAQIDSPDTALGDEEAARRERQRVFAKGVVQYEWDDQGRSLLVPASGNLFIVDRLSGTVKRRFADEETVQGSTDFRFSPRGTYVSFVKDGTLYAAEAGQGDAFPLTPAGGGGVSYGLAEFVAQEEFARDTGYWWSPDETAIAFTRADESNVTRVSWVDFGAGGRITKSQRFPLAGTENAVVELFVRRLGSADSIPMDLGDDPDFYLARVTWSKDAKTLYVQKQSRDQRTLELIAFDPATGKGRVILTERREPWVSIDLDFTPLDDGRFLWVSERSGFRHIYLYEANGQLVRQVTDGQWALAGRDRERGIVGVNQQLGLVYFMGFRDGPTERQLYVADYEKGGEVRRITSQAGWWTVTMNGDASAFIGVRSDVDTPPQSAIYRSNGTRLRWLVENRLGDGHPYDPYRLTHPLSEFGQLEAADGQALHYILRKPANFDPNRKYPVIVQVYGGPGRQKVTNAWRMPEERLFLDSGYLLFQLDNRGTLNRGLAFEAPIAGQLGSVEVDDQLTGLDFLRGLPFVDPERVGVTGWSYGGYMVLRLMTDPRSTIAAGAAGAPVTEWNSYDTHYTERFLGKPQDNPAAYEDSSVVARLDHLRGRLLYLHGLADDNVSFSHGVSVISRLQQLGKPFDLMLYPGQKHSITDTNAKVHLWRTYLEFFDRELKTDG